MTSLGRPDPAAGYRFPTTALNAYPRIFCIYRKRCKKIMFSKWQRFKFDKKFLGSESSCFHTVISSSDITRATKFIVN